MPEPGADLLTRRRGRRAPASPGRTRRWGRSPGTACARRSGGRSRSRWRQGPAAFDEETFGPLAALTVARDEEDAVRLTDATAHGLGLSVWTAHTARGVGLARRITSDDGVRQRRLRPRTGAAGIREFTSTRTYRVADSPGEE
ncbi:aldehyde dehydrogenase family protein [Streptomyces venetus]|uniref:aldehyde dehydrogenase family protein n=1 Tax=Streptomyces venetus TaxID=1701086 RepID=UPI0031F022A1